MSEIVRILSLGAGVQSTTVYLLIARGELPPALAAVFADTQEEPQAVYAHLWWLSQQGGPRIYIRSAGKLGDDLLMGRNTTGGRFASIPAFTRAPNGRSGMLRRQCSREYKTEVVGRCIRREVLGLAPRRSLPRNIIVEQLFGISLDEVGRSARVKQRVEQVRGYRARFPLIEMKLTRADCQEFNRKIVPHEVPRSACVFCPFHTNMEWSAIKARDAAGWSRSVEIDEGLRSGVVVNRKLNQPLFLHGSCKPLAEVDFTEKQMSLGFAAECEGMCGV